MTDKIQLLTGEQIKAARGLARMEQAQLAAQAGLSAQTVKRLEKIVDYIIA